MKKIVLLSLLIALPQIASAFTYSTGDDVVIIGSGSSISTTVEGDLFSINEHVIIQDNIGGSAHILADSITIMGSVDSDVRAAGSTLHIHGEVGDDMVVAAEDIIIHDTATIGGDAIVFASTVSSYGHIKGNARIRANTVYVSGIIDGSTDIQAEKLTYNVISGSSAILSAQELDIGLPTIINGDLHYWQPQGEYYFSTTSITGNTVYDTSLEYGNNQVAEAKSVLHILKGQFSYWFYASFIFIVLLAFSLKTYFRDAAAIIDSSLLKCFFYGLLFVLGTPLLIGLLSITVLLLPLALFILALYIFSLVYIDAFAALLITELFIKHKKLSPHFLQYVVISIIALTLLRILPVIPYIGRTIDVLIALSTFGALCIVEWKKFLTVR